MDPDLINWVFDDEPTLDPPARLSRVDEASWHAQADEADRCDIG